MHKKICFFATFLFVATLFTQSIFAQSLPDLAITDIGTDGDNRVVIIVKNVGKGRLPDTVWTNRNSKSPSITFQVGGKNWGGATIWKIDERRFLKGPGGKIIYVSNYVVKRTIRITAKINTFSQFRELNPTNNRRSELIQYRKKVGKTTTNTPIKGSFFINNSNFDLNKIKTINTMQEHVQWVSETNPQDVGKRLGDNKFKLLGGGIISAAGIKGTRLRAYVATKGNNVVVVFRGTGAGEGNLDQTLANTFFTDANVLMTRPVFFLRSSNLTRAQRRAQIHTGFNIAYTQLRSRILKALETQRGKNLYAFGHSLGGALATLFAADIAVNQPQNFRSLIHIVSGSPRVGGLAFAQLFERKVPNNLRVMINGDPVPTIPKRAGLRAKKKYIHVGRLLVLDFGGNIVSPNRIFVRTKLGNFEPHHNNKSYLKAVNTLMQRAIRLPQIYKRGTQIILEATRKEREKTK